MCKQKTSMCFSVSGPGGGLAENTATAAAGE